MRQLWATGWMHNRVRMIAASFLVKHLLIDWREGEAWFWDTHHRYGPRQQSRELAVGCGHRHRRSPLLSYFQSHPSGGEI
ncbi:FAD-binding domain-containing protein [Rhizobium sp. RCC_161_2]|uniref:FAD-binding domain-containing protein n=1 Tax=Rhizobium sp. RCC_161_2 TaxID=3239219 RepID=UPI0035254FE9